jgi:nucleoid-associated protein YgaU
VSRAEVGIEHIERPQIAEAQPAPSQPDAAETGEGSLDDTQPDGAPAAENRAPAPAEPEQDQEVAAAEPQEEAAPAAPPRAAARRARRSGGGDVHVVRRGDTLWEIAENAYGGGWRYTVIFKNNRKQIRDPHWIYPNQRFRLPRRR